ncbi:hypothetical protein TNCV_373811 [Trichonephila clavipes]|nr:hypothetical protein TNCV_373811 [Trichonephila clavipes]
MCLQLFDPLAVELGGMGFKEVRESLTHVCFIGEVLTPKMIVQEMKEVMKSICFIGSVELFGKYTTRLTTVFRNGRLQGFVIQGLGRPVRDLSQRDQSPDLNF